MGFHAPNGYGVGAHPLIASAELSCRPRRGRSREEVAGILKPMSGLNAALPGQFDELAKRGVEPRVLHRSSSGVGSGIVKASGSASPNAFKPVPVRFGESLRSASAMSARSGGRPSIAVTGACPEHATAGTSQELANRRSNG